MNRGANVTESAIPREEVLRRLTEYRRIGFEQQLNAQVVYAEGTDVCPWSGCGLRIRAINFRLDDVADPAMKRRWLSAWWQGPGVVGRCPHCGNHVLYGMEGMRSVDDAAQENAPFLPDDWSRRAHLVILPEEKCPT